MITRFAPSPTGPLHLGHAFSAMTASDMARADGGVFLLRIEDIDRARSKPEWEALIFEDLGWLGLDWPRPVLRQSDRLPAYREALGRLWDEGLLYPCTCSRRDIQEAASAPQEGVRIGPDGIVYPGTCRGAPRTGPLPDSVLRLDMQMALRRIGERAFDETGPSAPGWHTIDPQTLIEGAGDVVLARRDFGTSYHLSVVLDDAHQGVTHVVRGQDLFEATAIHVVLQALLDLPVPRYHHHRLIRDETGRRLAKRDDARAIRLYREDGKTPAELREMLGLGPQPSG
ncbi:tRNA glutamyl-Q(34) synthetase GluQRS [Ponticoccus sp. SC2-23]|uniref:tRNA glutamyl-Q(34) synthetase GluQRS n=1 Tax=Alexandriicola marinus TaxID=2081710 RepID=UPI000FD7F021|nr:tRNA glutamyl-Q(34) synthetase GluQRS [Alexandriicola marinus]MBM1218902.1 tRNA glutamyl-Q(34) synthetase GluQRS [Ponticoccus sp. SC6-9]MBM1224026.1 tRNA glutamyl-Q(34) synthetase GluQRS [Ponticoccus sp. SC6-15]MBM1230195.1 tRNA glutamyl-Q(34) synthetase GluQRS [Ponticoccus sp. SC6-38]MBM1232992.1 tRNA glutamyl-Q(34) synthetase GluQRS [Ponticoccus sp. SC6-45]MBM1237058.1 tRNA glutamyl-Q(34) synthetase GluQRS [Ponticoccus sp. SC6-49]MBM1242003.1 tRNA glutamyl-Q(34) synthetase GluQRS [Pontic